MESRVVPGLYFAGEAMDVDGITGGYNFQHAWASGWIAAQGMGGAVGSRQ
jgi:predicted flavoprotein YhiN